MFSGLAPNSQLAITGPSPGRVEQILIIVDFIQPLHRSTAAAILETCRAAPDLAERYLKLGKSYCLRPPVRLGAVTLAIYRIQTPFFPLPNLLPSATQVGKRSLRGVHHYAMVPSDSWASHSNNPTSPVPGVHWPHLLPLPAILNHSFHFISLPGG